MTFCTRALRPGLPAKAIGGFLLMTALGTMSVHAQDRAYADEYQHRIKSAGAIQSLGDAPFGENVDLYTGATSFEQTDLVLEGKGPPIQVIRRSTESDNSTENPLQFSGFGDWELEVPQIQTLVPGTLKYGSTVGVWQTWDASYQPSTNRCTYFGEMWTPPDKYYDPKSMTAPASSWWSGYTLKIPGMGSQPILARLPAAPAPASGTYPGVTTQHWQLGCQAGLGTTNGQPGEGFVVLAPDGTKYFMTHLSYATYATYREVDPTDVTIIAYVGRTIARMKASRVEDRFGNYITYGYTGDKLTSITGSDGRSVTIAWWPDAPLIQSITANGRTWTYNYASRSTTGGTLSQVVMPDARSWTFAGTALVGGNSPVYMSGCLGNDFPIPGSSTGIDQTYVIGHPSGLTGTFRYSARRRAQSYFASFCADDPLSDATYESSNPYFLVSSLVERQLSGPGMANVTWTYTYEVEHPSRWSDCQSISCPSTTYTDVVDPSGDRTRYIHSTRYGPLQGKLLRTETYQGASMLKRAEDKTYNYAESDLPYPATFGSTLYNADPAYGTQNLVVLRKSVISQQGRTFTWEVPPTSSGCSGELTGYCFDAYGRPTKIIKSSSP